MSGADRADKILGRLKALIPGKGHQRKFMSLYIILC